MQATLTSAAALSTYFADSAPASAADRTAARSSAAAVAGAVDSSSLLQGNKAVAISHNGSLYRLQATKLGKLILTK